MNAHPVAGTIQPNATGCHLTYMGGPLIQHVKVVDVFYSPSSAFATGLKANLEAWYAGVIASAHFDMLTEYNVTNFKIGHGTFVMSFEDTNPNPATVTALSDPGAYLKGLLDAHKLPAPDADTIYQMYFPSHIDPHLGGSASCISGGGFCAYHNSFSYGGGMVRYSVMPDTSSGSCAGGCGPAGFSGVCDVSSHEIVEAVTDPDGNGSWVDFTQNCGEIGDICAGGANETGTIPGTSFVVQKEWSNALNACAVNNPAVVINDFTLGMPGTVTVQQGGMATTTIATTKVGMAENVALTSMSLPTGVVVSFNPASITSDAGMSTITISAAATATLGTAKFTVKATDAAGNSHTQDVNINVVPPPDMSTLPDMAQGGGGNGGTGGGGSGGTGGNGGRNAGGCSCDIGGGGGLGAGWAAAALLLLGLAIRRRRA